MLDKTKWCWYNVKVPLGHKYADVAELADALDLGSSVPDMQVRFLSSAPVSWTLTFRQSRRSFFVLKNSVRCTKKLTPLTQVYVIVLNEIM